MKKFKVILATTKNDVLWYKNTLPWMWEYPEELEYFKKITSFSFNWENNILICWRKTFESMPKLKNRTIIVVSRSLESIENWYVVRSFDEAVSLAFKLNPLWVFVIWWKSIYIEAFNHYLCWEIYHTLIHKEYDWDTFLKLHNYNIISSDKKEDLEFRVLELNWEYDYLRMLSKIKNTWRHTWSRSWNTYSIFSEKLTFDLTKWFPLLTTKKMFWKWIVEELLSFIRWQTDSKILEEKWVNIWKWNTSQEFINSCWLYYKEWDMWPMYGWQWRHFWAEYVDNKTDYTWKWFDQLRKVIYEIETNSESRRIMMTDFNPAKAYLWVLYPCHSIILQFYVSWDYLDVNMYQRSVDTFLWLPFNIASTSLLLKMISEITNKIARNVNIITWDNHIYETHLKQVQTQLERTPLWFCNVEIPNFKTIEDIENSIFEDFKLIDYKSEPAIKAIMSI